MDQQHPRAEGGDVAHVVAGEQHRGAGASVVVGQKGAHRRLGVDIKAEGRLIEKQHRGLMQQRRQQLGLHPLPQRQLAHRPAQLGPQLEHRRQLIDAAAGLPVGDAVDGGIDGQGVERRQIPDQLLLLPHHQGDRPQEGGLAAGRHMPGHRHRAAARMDQAAEHLEGGGLASAVGAEEPHHLAGLDREVERPDRLNRSLATIEEMAEGSGQAWLLVGDLKAAAQPLGLDDRHDGPQPARRLKSASTEAWLRSTARRWRRLVRTA